MTKLAGLMISIAVFSYTATFAQQITRLDTTRDERGRVVLSIILPSTDSTLSKAIVYDRVKLGLSQFFENPNQAIHFSSAEEGLIYFRGNTGKLVYTNKTYFGNKEKRGGGSFDYEGMIQCKAGRAKLTLNNITHSGGSTPQMKKGSDFGDLMPSTWSTFGIAHVDEGWRGLKEQASAQFQQLIQSLQKALSRKADF